MSQIALLLRQKLSWTVIAVFFFKSTALVDATRDRRRSLSILLLLPLLLLLRPLLIRFESLVKSEVFVQFFLLLLGFFSPLFRHLLLQNEFLLQLLVEPFCHLLPRLQVRHLLALELLSLELILDLGDHNLRHLVLSEWLY